MSSLTGGTVTVMRTWVGSGAAGPRRIRTDARAGGRGTVFRAVRGTWGPARGRTVPGALLPAGWGVKVARGALRALGARNPQIIAGETVTRAIRARPYAPADLCPVGDTTVSRR